MPDKLAEDIVHAVAISNLKCVTEQPAMLSSLAYSNTVATTNQSQQNAVAGQQAYNELGVAVSGKSANIVSNLNPLQARSAVDVLTNDELAQTIADLKATVLAFQHPFPRPRPDTRFIIFEETEGDLHIFFEDERVKSISDLNIVNHVMNNNLIVSIAAKG